MAFADLNDNMDLAEDYLKHVFKVRCSNIAMKIWNFLKGISRKRTVERLQHVIKTPFELATYTYAIRILEKADKKFEFPVKWGIDLQSEHERYLAEEYFSKSR